jgi:hypothetical protein
MERAFHSMKLLPVRRTAIVGIVRVVVEAIGGSMTGAETAVEEELGAEESTRAEDVVITAAAARDRGGGGGEAAR